MWMGKGWRWWDCYVGNYSFPSLQLLDRKVFLSDIKSWLTNQSLESPGWPALMWSHMIKSGVVQIHPWSSTRALGEEAPPQTAALLTWIPKPHFSQRLHHAEMPSGELTHKESVFRAWKSLSYYHTDISYLGLQYILCLCLDSKMY